MNAFYLLSAVFTIAFGDYKSPEQVQKERQQKVDKLQKMRDEYAEIKARYRKAARPGDVLRKDYLQREIDKLEKELN